MHAEKANTFMGYSTHTVRPVRWHSLENMFLRASFQSMAIGFPLPAMMFEFQVVGAPWIVPPIRVQQGPVLDPPSNPRDYWP